MVTGSKVMIIETKVRIFKRYFRSRKTARDDGLDVSSDLGGKLKDDF